MTTMIAVFEGGPLNGETRAIAMVSNRYEIPMLTQYPYYAWAERDAPTHQDLHRGLYDYGGDLDQDRVRYVWSGVVCPFERDARRVGKHERRIDHNDLHYSQGAHLQPRTEDWGDWDEE